MLAGEEVAAAASEISLHKSCRGIKLRLLNSSETVFGHKNPQHYV